MNGFSFVISAVPILLVAGLMVAMPSITRRTLPLGVSVPQNRVDDPVVGSSIRGYRMAVIGSFVVCLALSVGLAALSVAADLIVPVLLVALLSTIAYFIARRRIMRAKQEQGWYAGVQVRLVADVSSDTEADSRPAPFGWFLVSLVLLSGVAAFGFSVYSGLPDPLPTHWNAAGDIDGYAAKSVWSVFGPLLWGYGIVVLFYLFTFLTRLPTRAVASVPAEENARRAALQRRLITSLFGQLSVVCSVAIGWLAVVSWTSRAGWAFGLGTTILIVMMVVAIGIFVIRYRRAAVSPLPAPDAGRPRHPEAAQPDDPDDDRYWKGGMIYVNRNDPSVFVPKRFGIGWTVNLGSVGGAAVGILLLLVIVVAVVVASQPRG